jgi:DNA-directed RNA polymerase subunit N (RpoN/RPB10)
MSDIVVDLFDRGWDDERIMEELGMERDEVLRLKQVSGLKKAFSGHEFSDSWTEYKDQHEEEKVEIDD